MNIISKPSPNFWKGRGSHKPELIVIHVMDGTLAGTDSWFASTQSQVSAHYSVGKNGEVHQHVQELDTAWHAGRVLNPTFTLHKPGVNPNLYTIGIEHEGKADTLWSDAMKKASAELVKDICTRHNIPIDRQHIIGHYQIFSGKPNCPGINKSVIDEIIALAKPQAASKVEQAIALLEQALSILKS